MRPRATEFEQAGARLAVIGSGWPAMAKAFAERVGFPATVSVLTDPARNAYEAAGFRRSAVLTLLNPRALVRFIRATLRGFRQGRTAGDPWQQGGALVVRPGGRIAFRYVSWGPGDHASADTLLEALNSAH